jgi:hypothetical protein
MRIASPNRVVPGGQAALAGPLTAAPFAGDDPSPASRRPRQQLRQPDQIERGAGEHQEPVDLG